MGLGTKPSPTRASSSAALNAALCPQSSNVAGDRFAVVVAHPDDETIGCGAQLARWPGVNVILITDGAPRSLVDARASGFATAEAYASARRNELLHALSAAGVAERRVTFLGVADQDAARHMSAIARELAAKLTSLRTGLIFTHAYEGGHPDHDATSFAVHASATMLSTEYAPAIIEMPFYRAAGTNAVNQRFEPMEGAHEIIIRLNPAQEALKRRMMSAHATQAGVLRGFTTDAERFRVSPGYDFQRLPNGGELLYEQHQWGMDASHWRKLATAAYSDLGLGGRLCSPS